MRKRRLAALLLLGGCVWSSISGAAPSAFQVKAVFLNGYAKFITWPAAAFASADTPFQICVFGENPFNTALDLVIVGETFNQRPVRAAYIQNQEQIAACQILYISDSAHIRVDAILETAKAYPILTVSDLDNFVQQGGMIQFYIRNNRVRFFIDPVTLREAGLEPNANLLRVSDIVAR